ncbi:hypothetical protein PIB30_095382 [Stylosanthes scabra]|uniref:Putative plant transposon protein domain-containing protein n=1 Tax=Stylosanthes scabra TaxID=79078 RepID=A0ABU6UY74_9FABA|nr:hypothetical protein [Stylosanthes scabra]
MVKEFYANAWEPDKARRKQRTYTSMVRGTEINFDPSNIKRVLKLRKDPIPNAPSYHERKANDDFSLGHILYDMFEEGAEWVRHRDGRPHYLRRSDLEPMPKGWYEFVCRSILPTTNRSELTLERAMLIHFIIIGENINVEEIITEQIYKTTNSSRGNGKNKGAESKESETNKTDARIRKPLDLGKYTESYQVLYHNEVEYRSHED